MIVNSWYNGYSPKERDEKYRELKRLISIGTLDSAKGPCDLCCDPDVAVEYHTVRKEILVCGGIISFLILLILL